MPLESHLLPLEFYELCLMIERKKITPSDTQGSDTQNWKRKVDINGSKSSTSFNSNRTKEKQ